MRGPLDLSPLPMQQRFLCNHHTWSRVECQFTGLVAMTSWPRFLIPLVSELPILTDTAHASANLGQGPKARTTTCIAAGIPASCPTIDGLSCLGLKRGLTSANGRCCQIAVLWQHALRHYRPFLLWYPKFFFFFLQTHTISIACSLSANKPNAPRPSIMHRPSVCLELAWFLLDAQITTAVSPRTDTARHVTAALCYLQLRGMRNPPACSQIVQRGTLSPFQQRVVPPTIRRVSRQSS
ncbi:hypothetical protein B0H67DRAFT_205122 [Lasiosphaeris hirsuta]|uniref:Uncharacterized protein n=1 Tax=Lasiosphaeris hirsuta TaxID=260670 RepID=A0AA40ARU9_9PEZI|nr:hypothetical protein B0H67DRAFT_205122 [Lasiosphaeris hirsuta]